MKHLFQTLLLICALLPFAACDTHSGWEEAPATLLPVDQQRQVLVEDFTGQRCVNCPTAAQLLKTIAQKRPGKVITVSMHAPMTGQTLPELAATEADDYARELGIPRSAPHISINRQSHNGKRYLTNRAEWEAAILQAVNTPAQYHIDLKTNVKDQQYHVDFSVRPTHTQQSSAPLDHLVWIVEDVRARQIVDGQMQPSYFHHNVFRTTVAKGALQLPQDAAPLQKSLTLSELPNVQHPENAKAVVILINPQTGEILEAAIAPFGKGISEDTPDVPTPTPDEPTPSEVDNYLWFSTESDGTGTTLRHGETLDCTHAIRIEHTELETPNLYLQRGKQQGDGQYELRISCLDDRDDAESGLSQVCIEGECLFLEPSDRKDFRVPFTMGDNPYFQQSLSIHYRVSPHRLDAPFTHRLRLDVYQDGKPTGHYFLNMVYDPSKVTLLNSSKMHPFFE